MKAFDDSSIRRSEVLQLIVLHHLYSHSRSRDVVFQGGTAIRWCHGGTRFSEDLDFVTDLPDGELRALAERTMKAVAREALAHFGGGETRFEPRSSRPGAFKGTATFIPPSHRQHIRVWVEFERLGKGARPATAPAVMSTLPPVTYLIAAGEFKIPRPNAVIIVETPEEILSDKVRALLERQYLKGRDLHDAWFLREHLGAATGPEAVAAKLGMYEAPFTARRRPRWFSRPTAAARREMADVLVRDLARFIPPAAFDALRAGAFGEIMASVSALFAGLEAAGFSLP